MTAEVEENKPYIIYIEGLAYSVMAMPRYFIDENNKQKLLDELYGGNENDTNKRNSESDSSI